MIGDKYRAWITDGPDAGQFVDVTEIHFERGHGQIHYRNSRGRYGVSPHPFFILERFTGHRDRALNEIYFGDILSGRDGEGRRVIGPVWFSQEWGRIIWGDNLTLTAPLAAKAEKVGDIHQHPELIKTGSPDKAPGGKAEG